jgi:voltage-gated potassium channel
MMRFLRATVTTMGEWDRSVRRLMWVGFALAGVLAYGVAGYMALEGWSLVDALYMTVTTLTTVGFTEARPLDASGRLFTVSVIVLGVGLALVTISMIASLIVAGEFGVRGRRRRMDRRIEQMRDHHIVCAYGRVGRAVVRELTAAGTRFVVVDPKEELRPRLEADGLAYLIEDPTLEPVLRKAGVDRARALVCAVDSDATNVYITLTARSLNPDLLIVARASEPGSVERLERAGADHVVSPFVSSGRHMARMVLEPDLVDAFEAGSSSGRAIMVEERLVEDDSALAGSSLREIPLSVLAIRRADGTLVPSPRPDTVLVSGDVVLVLGGG